MSRLQEQRSKIHQREDDTLLLPVYGTPDKIIKSTDPLKDPWNLPLHFIPGQVNLPQPHECVQAVNEGNVVEREV